MSTGSDIDEDELLQMALREQAERGQRPPPAAAGGKPVVNLVRPPQTSYPARNPSSGTSAPAKARKPSRGGDEDEDSEVELLSISSGEEDAPPRERGKQPPQQGRSKAAAARRPSRDQGEFDAGDDDEPRSWKQVDEAELTRRVREMREAKSAPGAVEVAAPRVLTTMQSLPRGVEVLDPLGLGVIDNKSLRLITDSLVSSPVSREKAAESLDAATREKVIYTSPNFDPKVFLARVHQETSAADLEAGALTLKAALKGKLQQKKQLVKENFDCFVSCKTTIDDIESKMRQIEEDPEGAGTARLFEVTQKISNIANRAYEPLFERQAQADKIRSVQGMLQRFRTLFNLPSTIRTSIRKGEYDLAVREYQKAKSIVLPSHVGILKRVLEEVERVMQEFRGKLYKSMEDPQLDLSELENIVRLLLELEPDADPVWHFLNIQNRRIRGLFEKCTLDYEGQMEVLDTKTNEKSQSDARWRQLQHESNKSLAVDSSVGDVSQAESQPTNLNADERDALRLTYIRKLIAVLIQHIPAFWKLSLSVFSGKFAKAAAGNVLTDSETTGKAAATDKVGEAKYTNHSLDEVATMVRGTVSVFETKVQTTFRSFEELNILRLYMSDTIQEIAKACRALEGKDSCPSAAVKTLRALHFETTKMYILRLCSWMRGTTKEISKYETWIILSTLERNKSPYAISFMPLEFREMIISVMDRIDSMIHNLRSETGKSFDISEQLYEINESVRLAFLNCVMDFAGYLENIGGELSQSIPTVEHLQNGYVNGVEKDISANKDGEVHRKLLIVLSNIGFCKDEVSQELYNKFKHIWLLDRNKDEQTADMRDLSSSYSGLEEKVLEQYTCSKSNLIRKAATNYLLDAGIQWGAAPPVKGIRDAAIEMLHIIVSVHAELYRGAKPLLEKAMGIFVEGLMDTFRSLFQENKTTDLKLLDANGFCQLLLELDYFETVLHTYFTPVACETLESLKGDLLDKACESVTESLETAGHNRRPTRGSEDALSDDKQQAPSISADDLLAIAQQCSDELLDAELVRTRLNIICFGELSLQLSAAKPPPVKPAYPPTYQVMTPTLQSPVAASPQSFRRQPTYTSAPAVAVSSRRRR